VAKVVTHALTGMGSLTWPGLLRMLDRRSPGYDA
jgi:hypothetical protein